MKKTMLTFCVSGFLLAATAWGQPIAQFDPAFPGMNVAFTADVYPGPGEGHGNVTNKTGWVHDGWAGTASSAALLRIESTLGGQTTQTALQEDEDWVFSATYNHTGAMTNEWPLFAKYDWDGSREDRMFAISADSATGTYGFLVGNASDGWYTAASGLTFSAWQDITIQYKVGLGLDFWLGNTLVATNQAVGHGRYDVNFMQAEWTKAGTDAWRQIKIGQVPEPVTMSLLGLGGLALLRRRKA